ncbi:hypothetical protein D3C80_1271520 [compost metagenome]
MAYISIARETISICIPILTLEYLKASPAATRMGQLYKAFAHYLLLFYKHAIGHLTFTVFNLVIREGKTVNNIKAKLLGHDD